MEMPRLESMRESWNIEQDKGCCFIVHRKQDSDESTLFVAKMTLKNMRNRLEWNKNIVTPVEEK